MRCFCCIYYHIYIIAVVLVMCIVMLFLLKKCICIEYTFFYDIIKVYKVKEVTYV